MIFMGNKSYVPRPNGVDNRILVYIVNHPGISVPDICWGLGRDSSRSYKAVRKLESGRYVYHRFGEGKRTSRTSKVYYPTNMGRRFISGPPKIVDL